MKDFISKPANFKKLEFWGATTLFVFAIFFLITNALNLRTESVTTEGITRTPFDYYFVAKLIRYLVFYGAFLLLNFRIVPEIIKRESLTINIILTIILFALIGLILGSTSTFLKYTMIPEFRTNRSTHNFLFQKGFLLSLWLLLLFAFYSVIKYTGIYLLTRSEELQNRYKIITPGGLAAFVLWMISMFFLIVGGAPMEAIAIWGNIIPFAIILYWYSFYSLIPQSQPKKRPFIAYLLKVILVLLISA